MDTNQERMLSEKEVRQLTGGSHAWIWRKMRDGEFPPSRKISSNKRGWLLSEIEEWMRSRPIAIGPSPAPKGTAL